MNAPMKKVSLSHSGKSRNRLAEFTAKSGVFSMFRTPDFASVTV